MDMENPLTFRFKIFPFLQERILPMYKEALRKEDSSTITFSPDEKVIFTQYTQLLMRLYKFDFKIEDTIDLKNTHPIFETMERHLMILNRCFYKLILNENEKTQILKNFDREMREVIVHVLS